MERLLWRGTILLLRLFGDFPPVFLFGSKISAHSTKQAPLFLELVSGTCGRNRSTPALPRPPLCVPTSTPKPRAVSSNLTAPANPLVPRLCENRMAWVLRTDFPKSSTKTAPHLSVFCVSAPRAAHLRLAMLHASRKIFLFFVYSTAIFEVGGACLFAEKKEVILPLCAAFSPPTGYSSDSSGNCPKIAATPVLTHRRMALRWEKMASVTP